MADETPSDVGPRAPIPIQGRKPPLRPRTRARAKQQHLASRSGPTDPLTPQEEKFVHEYLIDLDAPAAVLRAGYQSGSKEAASVQGSRLLSRRNVSLALNKAFEARMRRVDIKADDVLREVAHLAFADIGDVAEWEGSTITLRKSSALPRKLRAAIAEVKETKEGLHVKMHDKTAALTLLMKHLNLFPSTRFVHDPATGRTGMEIPGGGEDVIVLYQIPDNGRDALPVAVGAGGQNGHPAPG